GRAVVSPLAPFPIDINTAPREIIAACFSNLHMYGNNDPETSVTPKLAWDLAGRIVEERSKPLALTGDDHARQTGPFRNAKDFGRWLENLQKKAEITFN